MEAKYNLKHAKEILEPYAPKDYLRFDERGVWPGIERDLHLQTETEGLRWRPARQLQHLPGAPEVKDTPMLPNPFTARELAAFMLDGAGALVADFYGEWDDGPDPDSLRAIDPDSKARRAVTEAFTAYRLAIEKVGKYDMDALARRDAAHTAYWKSSNDKALSKAFEDAQAEWDAAHEAWLTKMVRCLLEPQTATPAPLTDRPSNAPAWTVNKPQRYSGYAAPLHRLLAAAHRDGNPCPTARDVVEAWRNNAPAEIAKVLPDGFDYYDAKGNTKTADLDAIRKAIGRMTIAR